MKSFYDEKYRILIDCLKSFRTNSNMTQQELASLLGCDQTYISKYEMGQRRLDIIEVRNICLILGVSLPELISEFEDKIRKAGM